MKKMLVGGTFDHDKGKESYIVSKLAESLGEEWECINGGNIEYIRSFNPESLTALIWMPNISNEEIKNLNNLKLLNPKMTLIQSKRVIEKQYEIMEVVHRIDKSKSELGIMITKRDDKYRFRLLNTLGTIVIDTNDIMQLGTAIRTSLEHIKEEEDKQPID